MIHIFRPTTPEQGFYEVSSVLEAGAFGGTGVPRLKFLDGLRGWAAIFVVLYHVFCDALPFDATIGGHLQFFLPFSGAIAIFIFFLVSGFSLSIDYLARGDLKAWARTTVGRHLRLAIPIFCACFVVHVAMLAGAIDPPSERLAKFQTALDFTPTLDHLLRFSFFGVFFDYRDTYIGPLWTMRFELAGSFVALFAVLLLRPAPYRPLLFTVLATLFLIFTPDSDYAMIALFPIGCALADCFHRGWIKAVPGHVAWTLICIAIAIPLFVPYSMTAWGAIGTTALVVGCIALPPVRRFLETPLSVQLGNLCFPLYLIHGPVIWLLGEPLMRNFGQNLTTRILIDFLVIGASIIAAVAFSPANNLAVAVARYIGNAATGLVRIGRAGEKFKKPA